LAAIESNDVTIGLTDGNSSCLITADTDTASRFVVMPMRQTGSRGASFAAGEVLQTG
jgi:hypothetical protein